MLEFTLAGIPLIFAMVSIFEMSRGMWLYHSMAHAANMGARFAVVKGRGCAAPGNSCGVTVDTVARRIAWAAIGLVPDSLEVQLASEAGPVDCNPLSSCFGDPTPWPPGGANAPGMDIQVTVRHEFRSAMAMFWPGAGSVRFGAATLAAGARQRIEF